MYIHYSHNCIRIRISFDSTLALCLWCRGPTWVMILLLWLVFGADFGQRSSKNPMSSDTTPSQPAIAVALPPRPRSAEDINQTNKKPPVWSLQQSSAIDAPEVPLPAKCDRHGQPGGICCKELKDDDERQLVDPNVVRDMWVISFHDYC